MLKNLRYIFQSFLFLLGVIIAHIIGRRACIWIGCKIFSYDWLINKKRAQILRSNIAQVFPDMNETERDSLIIQVQRTFGIFAGEILFSRQLLNERKRMKFIGMEHVQKIWEQGKPVIFISGHLSNWEMVRTLGRLEKPVGIAAVLTENPIINRIFAFLRHVENFITIPSGQSGTRALISWLRAGISVVIINDHHHNEGVEVEFFNQTVRTASGAARLAQRFDVPLVPTSMWREEREGDPSYFVMQFFEPIYVGKGEKAVQSAMQAFYNHLSAWIKARPEEWHWYYRRWRD